MTPQQHQRLRALFDAACDCADDDALTAFIAETCADDLLIADKLRSMWREDRSGAEAFDTPAQGGVNLEQLVSPPTEIPTHIASYRIESLIGEGGMGRVYRAIQDAPQRTVALKVLRAGRSTPALQRRFELESEILGRLQHPGIAQVFEAGTFDDGSGPQHYFAMELVDGPSLTTYVARHASSIRDRLALLADIAEAAHHAHQRGIVHRDLKPDNVLVEASGRCRILDFGIARLVDHDARMTMQTQAGQIVGTLAYMPPEQLESVGDSDPDSRGDVYSLGVIGYELLTGRLPFETDGQSIAEIVRTITSSAAPPVGTLDRTLRGDVETIIARAMARDRELRYPSASELASDLRRFLADEPIVARPPSAVYQLRKLAQRHRAATVGIVLALVSLVGGIVATSVQLRRTIRAEAMARAEKSEATAVTEFIRNVFIHADPIEGAGHDARVVDVLDRASEDLATSFDDQPAVKAELHSILGMTYRELGLLDRARGHLESCVELQRALAVDPDTEHTYLQSLNSLALLHRQSGDPDRAIPLYEEAIAAYERRGTLATEPVIVIVQNLAKALDRAGRDEEADVAFQRSIALHRDVLEPDAPGLAICLSTYASVLGADDRWSEAAPLHQEAYAIFCARMPEDHPFRAFGATGLGECLSALGRHDEAIELLRPALATVTAAYGAESIHSASVAFHLGRALVESEQPDEAATHLRDSVRTALAVEGERSQHVVRGRILLARAMLARQQPDDAAALLELVREQDDETLGAFRSHEASLWLALARRDVSRAESLADELDSHIGSSVVQLQSARSVLRAVAEAVRLDGRDRDAATWERRAADLRAP